MDFNGFDPKKLDDYSAQAKTLYGKTDAYKEFAQKSKGRTNEQEKALGGQVMDFFLRLGAMKEKDPGSEGKACFSIRCPKSFSYNLPQHLRKQDWLSGGF